MEQTFSSLAEEISSLGQTSIVYKMTSKDAVLLALLVKAKEQYKPSVGQEAAKAAKQFVEETAKHIGHCPRLQNFLLHGRFKEDSYIEMARTALSGFDIVQHHKIATDGTETPNPVL